MSDHPAPADLPLVIVGYGGHGSVVADAAVAQGRHVLGYCDHVRRSGGATVLDYLGAEAAYFERAREAAYFVAIGSNARRASVTEALRPVARAAQAVVHPAAVVSHGAAVGELALVGALAVVQPAASIGRGAIVNTAAVVEHDVTIGAFAHIAPNATLAGGATVGPHGFVGAGACVLPGITVGVGATVGAGAVVTKDVPEGEVWVGSPARPLHR